MRLLSGLILLAVLPTSAQTSGLGGWAVYSGQVRVAGTPFSVQTGAQVRTHGLVSDLDQWLVQVGPQVSLPDRAATFTAGYMFLRSESAGTPDEPYDEHRPYQEALVPQRAGSVTLSHRLRLEERFVAGRSVQTRARYALSASVPLTGDGSRRGSVYAAAYAEPFLRGPGRGDRPVYDRTRLYGGVGYRLRANLGVQAGYLAQVFDGSVDHQLQLSLHHVVTR